MTDTSAVTSTNNNDNLIGGLWGFEKKAGFCTPDGNVYPTIPHRTIADF